MKILITGGAGYLGSILCDILIERIKNVQLFVIDNLSNVRSLNLNSKVFFSNIDLTDSSNLKKYFEERSFDLVIHLAAKIYVHESFLKAEEYQFNNTQATCNLIAECKKKGINKIIFASSSTLYRSTDENRISEEGFLDPLNPYGKTKLDCEKLFLNSNFQFTGYIFRIFNMSGADSDLIKGQNSKEPIHVIDRFSHQLMSHNQQITIRGHDLATFDGTVIRDYIHVSDVAELFVAAVTKIQTEDTLRIFNCGSGIGTSLLQIAHHFQNILGLEVDISFLKYHPGDPICLISDSDKARAYFGWKPHRSTLDQIIKSAIVWSQKRKNYSQVN